MVNGTQVTSPYSFQSVIGITHVLKAPQTQVANGQYYAFENWDGSLNINTNSFIAAENEMTFKANFSSTPSGRGNGLKGSYFNEPPYDFQKEPILERIDSVIDLNVGLGTPDTLVDINFISILWEGEIEPYLLIYTHFISFLMMVFACLSTACWLLIIGLIKLLWKVQDKSF